MLESHPFPPSTHTPPHIHTHIPFISFSFCVLYWPLPTILHSTQSPFPTQKFVLLIVWCISCCHFKYALNKNIYIYLENVMGFLLLLFLIYINGKILYRFFSLFSLSSIFWRFFHVRYYRAFFVIAAWYFVVQIYDYLYNHSPVNGHWNYFCFFSINRILQLT